MEGYRSRAFKECDDRSLKNLAEGIILQALEDLYESDAREDSKEFFRSRDLVVCAEMAEMDTASQVRLLDFVKRLIAVSARRQARHKATHDPGLVISACIAFNAFIYHFLNLIFSLEVPVTGI